MHHALSLSKILPSFNVGIVLALIWCFSLSWKKGEKCAGGEKGEKKVCCLQRGSTMLFMFKCIKCAVYTMIYFKKKRSTDVQISVCPHTDGSPVSSPSVHSKVKKSSKCSHDYSHVYNLRQFFESCTVTFSSPLCVVESGIKEEIVEDVCDESDDEYDVYDHLDTVPIKMPTPLSWQDYMYTPTQISVHGMENKGPLRPIDQKPNMRGDSDYDDLSPNQQAKRDLDQFYEYQAKVLAETSARTPKKIKTRVWTATKSSKPSKVDFTSELKQVTQQHREKTRATYISPDPITQENYVKPEQKRDQEPSLQLTPKRKNIVYQEGETVEERAQKTNNTSPIPPSRGSSCSLSLTQSSASPVDNLLAKFQKATWVTKPPSPPPLPALPPPVSLPNHDANSPFKPINSRGSSPRTSTPILTPNQGPSPFSALTHGHKNPSPTPSHKSHKSNHGVSLSRNSCGSQNSSVYQAKIESLQDQVQILLNQSAEKEDKLQRMESELEDTKRQMKELINLYKQEQVKKTIEEQIPTSRRGSRKDAF